MGFGGSSSSVSVSDSYLLKDIHQCYSIYIQGTYPYLYPCSGDQNQVLKNLNEDCNQIFKGDNVSEG